MALPRLAEWADELSEHRRDAEEARLAMQDWPDLEDAYADLDDYCDLVDALVALLECVDEMPALRQDFQALQECGAEVRRDVSAS